MIKSEDLIPEIYNTSYDFSIFKAAIDLVFNAAEFRISSLIGLHSPENCFNELLPHLATLVNLKSSTDRQLLKQFMLMKKSKGTEPTFRGILIACGANGEKIEINKNFKTVKIVCDSFNSKLFKELIGKLAPFNFNLSLEITPENKTA